MVRGLHGGSVSPEAGLEAKPRWRVHPFGPDLPAGFVGHPDVRPSSVLGPMRPGNPEWEAWKRRLDAPAPVPERETEAPSEAEMVEWERSIEERDLGDFEWPDRVRRLIAALRAARRGTL